MSEAFVGEIRMFGFNFAPTGWAFCDGQILPITQNTALFSLLGTFYGGDGRSTFALPDLRGRAPLQWGQGPGLSNYDQAVPGGVNTVALVPAEFPVHTHTLMARAAAATSGVPSGSVALATANTSTYGAAQNLSPMAPVGTSAAPHENRQPHLTVNFCIALQGIFPPRS